MTRLANRPPFTLATVQALIDSGSFQEAKNACDANTIYFAEKYEQSRALFKQAEQAERGYAR